MSEVASGRGAYDMILVGGGLQNCLIAGSVLSVRPQARVLMIEAAPRLAGNHTWCFHPRDLPKVVSKACTGFVERCWPAYEVHFPRLRRLVQSEYAMMTSERVHQQVSALIASSEHAALLLCTEVVSISPGEVSTRDGRSFTAPVVVDSRGPVQSPSGDTHEAERLSKNAYQKFLGLEVELAEDYQNTAPTLIDAEVEQRDGFRFLYVLPIAKRRLLLEDTYFSTSPELDIERIEARIRAYAASRDIQIRRIIRREHGVLPLPLGRMPGRKPEQGPRGLLVSGGYGGGWFHPTTGYSMSAAAHLAEYLASTESSKVTVAGVERVRQSIRSQTRFGIWLNRLMFRAFQESERYASLERFYSLPVPVIENFYALRMGPGDRTRILCGRPPRGFSVSRLIRNTVSLPVSKPGLYA